MVLPWANFVLVVLGVIVIPLLVFVVKGLVRDQEIAMDLKKVTADVERLVKDKDLTHQLMREEVKQVTTAIREDIRLDRDATNKRLRWLEEHLWNRSA